MNWSRYQTVSAIVCAVLITTGAIVPFVSPVEAQTGQPDPDIDSVDVPGQITLGESFEVEVEGDNDGGRAGHYSTISVSSPNLDDWGDDSQLRVTDDFDHAYSTVRDRGDSIFDRSGDQTTADYALAEAGSTGQTYWDGGESRDFAVEFTPEETGTFVVYVRVTHTDDDSGAVFNDPSYGTEDQQDYEVRRFEVEVREETQISAEVEDVDPAAGSYTAGEDASTETTVRNTGNRRHEFYVGYSVRGPEGEWRDNDGSTHESVWLDPGETETVTVDWEVEDAAPTGEYDVWTTVYRDEQYGDLEDRLDGERRGDEFSVTTENSPPNLEADRPSDQTTVSPGEGVDFEVDVDDPDGNLRGVDWYVDGDLEEQSWIGGGSETVSWRNAFDSAGTYRVEAQAHDEEGEYSESVSWTVEVEEPERIAAEIRDVDWPSGEVTSSDRVDTSVEVKNTGNTGHEFHVGYSVRGPDGEWRDNDGSTHESIWLDPGETRTVTVDWEVEDGAPTGEYDVWTTVYRDERYGDLEDRLDGERRGDVFEVAAENSPPTLRADAPSDQTTVTAGEEVDFEVDVEDSDGNLQGVDWYVEGTHEESSYVYGSSASPRWDTIFDSSGTYRVEARAHDEEGQHSDPVSWTVEVEEPERIQAAIGDVDWPNDEATYSDRVETSVEVENTGNTRHEFQVGYSVRGPDGDWRDNDGSTHESVWLDPGETQTVTVDWEVEDDAPTGEYDVWTTVYRDERYGDLEDRLDGERQWDEFSVTTENSAPTLQANDPSDQTTVTVGEEVDFEVDAEDPDGYLRGVDWYVDGDLEEQSWIDGASETASWTTAFESAGTYQIEAEVNDDEGEYSDPVSWTVEVEEPDRIKAEIEDVDWPSGEMTSSDHVETSVEVENTGNTRHEFYVGYSVRGPDGEWRDNDGSTHESVTLSPGEQRQMNVEWEITDEAPAGDYDVWTTVYADRSGQELQDKRDERRQSSVFSVEETNQTGTVTGYVTTSDGDGLEDVSVTVGGINVETNPDGYYDAENVPIGKRTVSAIIEGQEYTKQQSVSAGQQVTTDIEVDLQTTDIQITSFDPQTGTFSPGDEITASVGLVNEGNEEKTVRATLGHRGPTGTLLDGGDESTTSLTLAPSQQTTTELSWTVGDDPNVGTYDAVLTVSAGDSQIAQSAENDSVNLQSTDDAATLLDYSQESGTYEPDDTIEVEFAVENNEESSTTYYVEYVARGSNGETYANDAYFVTRPPSGAESPPTTIRYAVPESAPNGTYDGVLRVWKGRSPDTSQPPADQVTMSDAFSVENPNASEPEPPDEEAPTGNVTIRVEGSSGEAVEGTKVGINLLGDNKEKTVGNDGVATFEVPRRDVKYTAYYVGRSDIIQERKPVLVDSEGPHDVAFEIKETGTLRGTVTIDGEPVTGDITLQGSETQIEDGVFEFDDKVPIGYKTLVIDPDGNGPTRYASVRIEPGENGETIQITERFRIGEYVSGAVLGDIGYRNRETISVEYTLGWMTSTTIPISDVRDLASSASAGDKVDTAVNVVAIVPLVGDSSTVISRIGKFVKKAPPKAVRDFAKIIRRSSKFNGMRYRALSELGYGDTLESLTRAGFSRAEATKLASVAKSSDVSTDALRSAVSKADVAPKAVRKAVKNEETGDVVLLTKGVRNEDGWTHIVRGHIGGTDRVIDSYKTFFPTGKEVKFKKHADEVLPARMTEKQVEEMVLTAIKKGDEPTDIGGGVAYTIDPRKHGYDVGITKIQVEVSDGIVKTAYPTKGPSVYEYRPNGELIKGAS